MLAGVALLVVVTAAMGLMSRAKITGETPAERIACIGRLADEQPWGAALVIAEAAVAESDDEVRRAAVIALRKFAADHREAVEACTRDRSARVRAAAACTLGRLADADAARRLGRMLNDGKEDEAVRAAAAAGLADNDSPEATVLLVRTMEAHSIPNVQDHAAAVLVRKYALIRVKANPQAISEFRRKQRANWLDLVETVKMLSETKTAFEKLDQPLVLRPENLIKRPVDH